MAVERRPAGDWGTILGLLALGMAGYGALVMALAAVLSFTAWRSGDLADRLSRMIFDHGFLLDVLAVAFGLGAMRCGGRGKRLGTVAMMLVALSFVLMFFT